MSGRVYAIYEQKKPMMFLFATLIAGMVIIFVVAQRGAVMEPLPPIASACLVQNANSTVFPLFYSYLAAFDSLIFGLTAYRCIRTWRQYGRIPLFQAILKDGILYFFVIATANIINAFFYGFKRGPVARRINIPVATLTSVMCWRLYLSLRKTASFYGRSHPSQPSSSLAGQARLASGDNQKVPPSDESIELSGIGSRRRTVGGQGVPDPTGDADQEDTPAAIDEPSGVSGNRDCVEEIIDTGGDSGHHRTPGGQSECA